MTASTENLESTNNNNFIQRLLPNALKKLLLRKLSEKESKANTHPDIDATEAQDHRPTPANRSLLPTLGSIAIIAFVGAFIAVLWSGTLIYTDFNALINATAQGDYHQIILLGRDGLYIGVAFLVATYLLDLANLLNPKILGAKDTTQKKDDFYSETNRHLDRMIWRLSFFEKFWIAFGLICVIAAGYFAWDTYSQTSNLINGDIDNLAIAKETPSFLHYILLIKGIFLTSIPAALATYSFKISRAYIHERLKRQERKHAINFGKFILKKFDISTVKEDAIGVNELVDIFQWNIANETAFNKQSYNKIEGEYWANVTNYTRRKTKAFTGTAPDDAKDTL